MTMTLQAPAPQLAGRREWTALAVLALPLLLVSMDVSILYFAVPDIARDLHATSTQQLWIFDVYGFVLAGLLVTMGAVARPGRRPAAAADRRRRVLRHLPRGGVRPVGR